MIKKHFKYFVSYFFEKEVNSNISGIGCVEIERKNKIKKFNDLNEISQLICSKNKFNNVMVLNWKELK